MNEENKQAIIRTPIYEINEKSIYICGLDVARTGKDETAIVILEQLPFDDNIFIKCIETLHTPDLRAAIGKIEYLDSIFHFKKVIIDETGIGAGVTDVLKNKLKGRVEGVWYTNKSKNELFLNLKLLMSRNNRKLYIPDFSVSTDSIVRKMFYQFLSIKQEVSDKSDNLRITHEEREHDDIINAICLAASYFSVLKRKRTYGLCAR